LKVKIEVGLKSEIPFLTQHLGLSIFYANLGSNNPALFRVQCLVLTLWCSKMTNLFSMKEISYAKYFRGFYGTLYLPV